MMSRRSVAEAAERARFETAPAVMIVPAATATSAETLTLSPDPAETTPPEMTPFSCPSATDADQSVRSE